MNKIIMNITRNTDATITFNNYEYLLLESSKMREQLRKQFLFESIKTFNFKNGCNAKIKKN